MTNGHSNKCEIPESARCVRTISEHYYGDSCPGHHLDFIHLVEPRVIEDDEEPMSKAQKLRLADTYPDILLPKRTVGKVYREKVEAFESYNSETWDPEEEGP